MKLDLPILRKCVPLSTCVVLLCTMQAEAHVDWLPLRTASADYVQQQGSVIGKIQNSASQIVRGATITNLSISKKTSSGSAGTFDLQAKVGDTLLITAVGYHSQEVVVDSESLLITLQENTADLDEVVVTAIGIKQQKKKVGYATQEVKTDVLKESKTMNIGTALTGQVSGLIVNNPTGIFQAPTFLLRGGSPLIVIDGVVVESNLFDVPSQNIENINVLKGTAASSLYGSRGRDGAILITTKNAKKDGLEFSFGTTNMFSAGFTVFPETQTEYGSGSNGKYEFWDGRDGGISDGDMTWGPRLNSGLKIPQWNSPIRDKATGEVIPWWGDVAGTKYDDKSKYERVPIDWVSHDNLKNFLQTGLVTENNATISYRSDKVSIFGSGKYAFQKGQVPNTKLATAGVNLNTSFRFTPDVQFNLNLAYGKVKSPNYPRYGYGPRNHMYTILLWMGEDVNGQDLRNHQYVPSLEGYRQANYNYAWYNNPYFAAYELNQVYDQDMLNGLGELSWKVTPELVVKGRAAARQQYTFKDMQSPKSYMNYGDSRNGDYKMWNDKQLNFDADILVSYDKSFSEQFGMTINAGGSTFNRQINKMHQATDGLVVPFIYNVGNSQGPLKGENEWREKIIRSAYSSVNFTLFSSTFLNFSGRNDWSSTLPKKNQSYFYPSVSLSTIVSDYFKMPQQIDYIKLYSSWASADNDLEEHQIVSTYVKSLTYESTPSVGYKKEIVNPEIRPEKMASFEIGTAIALFKNRLSADVTYYNVISQYQIINQKISKASGFESRKVNGNRYRKQGLEIALTGRVVQHTDFNWTSTINWSRNVKRIEEIVDNKKTYENLKKGDRADSFYATVWEKSADGRLILDPHELLPKKNPYLSNLGHFDPDWQFGFMNRFDVKGFTVNVDIDGAIGGVLNSTTIEKMWWGGKHPSSTLYRQQQYDAGKSVYVPNGVIVTGGELVRDVDGKVVSDTRTYAQNTKAVDWQVWSQNYPYQARVTESEDKFFANVFDRSFVKLRRLSVGYDVNKLLKSKKLNALNASVYGYNLLMWKKVPYIDPDFKVGNDDQLQDPSTRYLGFSLDFKF